MDGLVRECSSTSILILPVCWRYPRSLPEKLWYAQSVSWKIFCHLTHGGMRSLTPPPPTRQVHSNAHCCFWSGHSENKVTLGRCVGAVIHKHENRHKVPKSVLRAVFGRSGSHPSCDSSNTSRRLALVASNVCLLGENPTCSVPA